MSPAIIFPPEEYSEVEKERLLEFRKSCTSLDLTDEQKTDAQLIRWLRARDLDLTKAFKMLEQHLQWRRENKIDGILEREKVPDKLLNATPWALLGVDKQGYPILLAPFGQQDSKALIEEYGEELFTKATFMNMERIQKVLRKVSQEQGREVTQVVEIMDLEGYSFKQFTNKRCRDLMGKIQKQFDNNYPEVLRLVVAVNAPKLFHVVFKAFKPFMSKRTLEKIDIYGTDRQSWEKVVRERFPPELVPKHWGGDKEGDDEFCSKDEIWINGPVSDEYFAGLTSIYPEEGLTTVTVSARDTLKIPVEIKIPNSSILFRFRCENHDISWEILDPTDKVIAGQSRASATKKLEDVHAEAEVAGMYTLQFDNSYSLARSKTIDYTLDVVEPVEDADADKEE